MSNTFGNYFRWTTFGESHGAALGIVIDGCPSQVIWNESLLRKNLERRRPGQVDASGEVVVTDRNELDRVEVLSGVFDGQTLGTPIACMVANTNQRSQDYNDIKTNSRVGHADDVWRLKYGHVDHRGGGRSSGRETLCRVIAGSVAQMVLNSRYPELKVTAYARRIGEHELTLEERNEASNKNIDGFSARFPSEQIDIADYLLQAKQQGESYGGIIEVVATGVPAGLGEPIYNKLKAQLASAMMSIGATSGFDLGGGFDLAHQKGTDVHTTVDSSVYGGIRGGIATGDPICFRVAFKPTSSITDVAKKGRHDPCIVPRAVPVVEAMTWAVLVDQVMAGK